MKQSSVRTFLLAATLLLQWGFCSRSHAAAGDVDLSFDPGSGVNGTVNAVAVQPDGKVIIGGEFTTVRGLVRANVARLNTDGSGDSSFTAGTFTVQNRTVYSLALQPDGKVLVGHLHGFTRLLSDGNVDPGFSPAGTAAIDWINDGFYDGVVYCSALQPDGKVLIGGIFDWVNGAVVNLGLARLNADGSLDTGFSVWSGFQDQRGSYIGQVRSVAVQTDGKVLVVGDWNAVSSTRHGIFRLNADGSLDDSFNPGIGSGTVSVVVVQPDGRVLLGGYPLTVNGTNIASGIARLETNGSMDGSFNPGSGTYGGIRSIALLPDGKMLLGGGFTSIDGPNHIVRLNADGSRDNSFTPDPGANGAVSAIVVQSNGKVLVVGYFTAFNGTNRNRIARLNADGGLDASFDPGIGLESWGVLFVQPDGKVLMGGRYTFINGTNRYGIARLNADGSVDNTFVQDNSFGPDLGVVGSDYSVANSLVVQSDGKVLIGGYTYTELDTGDGGYFPVYSYFLTRFNANGSRDTSFEPAVGNQSFYDLETVRALAVQPDGKIVVGGTFSNIKGTNRNGIARLNANGSLDNGFNAGTGNYFSVYSVALQSDGKVLIGGSFSVVNGTNHGIARLNANGSLDGSFNPGTGANGVVRSIAVQPDGKVLIGGEFTTVNGTNRNHIARLNANGSLDLSFNPGTGANGIVRSIALQPDGNLLLGGNFTTVNGVLRPYVARLYGDSEPPATFASWAASFGLSGAASAADADPDGDGLSGGAEYILGGNPAVAAASARPVATIGGGNLVFTFPRIDASETPDVTLAVEISTDLVNWPTVFTIGPTTAASSPGVSILEIGTGPDTITVTIPQGTDSRMFARMRVTIVP